MSARFLAPVLVGLAMLGLWEAVVRVAEIPPYVLPGPLLIARTLVSDWSTLWPALVITLEITLQALIAAVVIGVLLAVLFSLSRWIELSFFPYAIILQVTPISRDSPTTLSPVVLDPRGRRRSASSSTSRRRTTSSSTSSSARSSRRRVSDGYLHV